MEISRRRFLEASAAVAVVTRLPFGWFEEVLAKAGGPGATGTTLDQTILVPSGSSYGSLTVGPGEPWIAHPDNPLAGGTGSPRTTLLAFSQLSDIHITDAQSPLRVEWMDRFAGQPGCPSPFPVGSAFRPQELISTQTMAAMVAALNQVQAARVGSAQKPLSFAVSTGDNTDNQHWNELDWFRRGIVGGRLGPNSGDSGRYEGVQSTNWGDLAYWLPDDSVRDVYKRTYGFPGESAWRFGRGQFLTSAIAPFDSPGLNHPCKVAFGNHDGLVQGTVSATALYRQIATGEQKPTAGPDMSSCASVGDSSTWFTGPTKRVTADPARRLVSRKEYIETLVGHGFTPANAAAGFAYYAIDDYPGFRLIVVDTVNPGGKEDGSIGQVQFDWLQARIAETSDRYVILFSHHGLHSLTNPLPDASEDPDLLTSGYVPDNPRYLAQQVEAMLHQHPNVIAWVAGHTHQNRITKRQGANGHVFWDIETAAHVDWPCQSRIIEVIDDGPALTIRCTMVDHAGPVRQRDIATTKDPMLKLAGIHRELAGNDPQINKIDGSGSHQDRNVDLTVPKPLLA